MDQELRAIPQGERVILGGDLNGHVGISREAIERIHGGWGVGEKNGEGEMVKILRWHLIHRSLIPSSRRDQTIAVTYKSGGRESQIDFLMMDYESEIKIYYYIIINM